MNAPQRPSTFPAILAAWIAFLVVDFLLHAVFLAPWWRETASSWLPPELLFQRIPFGYAAFAIYVATLVGLMARLCGPRPTAARAFLFGVRAGALAGVAWVLATYSVFPMPLSALLVWPGSLVLESAVAAPVAAWVQAGDTPWRRVGATFAAGLLLLAIGVAIQSLGGA